MIVFLTMWDFVATQFKKSADPNRQKTGIYQAK
jgi:hypothetical protein